MLNQISQFLFDERIITIKPGIYSNHNSKQIYQLHINDYENVKSFLDYLYKDSNIYLSRKYNKYISFYQDEHSVTHKKGVYYDKRSKVYIVTIRINGKRYNKSYKILSEAIEARKNLEIEKAKIETAHLVSNNLGK